MRCAASELVAAHECEMYRDDLSEELSNGTSSWGGRTLTHHLVCDPTTLAVMAVGGLWLG